MSAIFAKTRKGQDEIEQRSAGLGPRARRLLILLDGKRALDDVRALMPDPKLDETLAVLVDGAFIEVSGGAPAAASVATPVATPVATWVATSVAPAAAASAPAAAPALADERPHDPARLEQARNFMINSMRTFNGPYGNIALMTRVKDSANAADLRALVGEWSDSINLTKAGRQRAEELKSKLLEVL